MFKKLLVLLVIANSLVCASKPIKGFFKPVPEEIENKLPIIFHPDYDISLLGLEKLHPFDSCKYGKVAEYLAQHGICKTRFYEPKKITDQELTQVHSQAYLDSLKDSSVVARITEIGLLSYVPHFLVKRTLLNAMKLATGGTVLGADLALKEGWAINLSGGYHHAKAQNGEGFCVYADIPLAVKKVLEKHPDFKIMVIDLDAHQGNGHESCLKDEKRVTIFDIYNKDVYPHDIEAQKRIDFNYPVPAGITDEPYLSLVSTYVPQALDQVQPNLIIYNAGTDIFGEDPLGRMRISEQGIIKRDELVFTYAKERNIPILMVLSGGYTQKSASIIGKSIHHVLTNVLNVH